MGAGPVSADVDPDTYGLDVESVRQAITPGTKAIVPVHLAVRFTEMDGLCALAAQNGLKIMEDCAHANGGAYRGKGAGSMGDIGTFSMQESKLMTAGEGGMVTTNSLACYEALQTVINCGRASITDEYGQRLLGLNYRMTDLQIALLIGQMETLPALREKRAQSAALLQSTGANPCVQVFSASPSRSRRSTLRFPIPPRGGQARASRDLFVAALEKGILAMADSETVYKTISSPRRELRATPSGPRDGDGLRAVPLPGVGARRLRRIRVAVPVRADGRGRRRALPGARRGKGRREFGDAGGAGSVTGRREGDGACATRAF